MEIYEGDNKDETIVDFSEYRIYRIDFTDSLIILKKDEHIVIIKGIDIR